MAAKQSQPAQRLKFLTAFMPALENVRVEIVPQFFQARADGLRPGDMRRGVWSKEPLGFEKGGHRFVVTALTVQNAAEFIMRPRADVAFGICRKGLQNYFRFRQPARLTFQSGADQQGGRKI